MLLVLCCVEWPPCEAAQTRYGRRPFSHPAAEKRESKASPSLSFQRLFFKESHLRPSICHQSQSGGTRLPGASEATSSARHFACERRPPVPSSPQKIPKSLKLPPTPSTICLSAPPPGETHGDTTIGSRF